MELDLHVHSKYSFDSRLEPADIIKAAIARGLSGVAVCDHNTCEGGVETRRLAPPGFIVIPGIELGCETVGDVLGLFVDEMERPDMQQALETREVRDFIRAVKAQNGLLVLPHPSGVGMTYLESERLIARFDGIESYNSRRAERDFDEPGDGDPHVAGYARRHKLALTAGSDAHTAAEVGRGRTIIPAEDEDGIRQAFHVRGTLVRGSRTGPAAKVFSQLLRFLGLGGAPGSARSGPLEGE